MISPFVSTRISLHGMTACVAAHDDFEQAIAFLMVFVGHCVPRKVKKKKRRIKGTSKIIRSEICFRGFNDVGQY